MECQLEKEFCPLQLNFDRCTMKIFLPQSFLNRILGQCLFSSCSIYLSRPYIVAEYRVKVYVFRICDLSNFGVDKFSCLIAYTVLQIKGKITKYKLSEGTFPP